MTRRDDGVKVLFLAKVIDLLKEKIFGARNGSDASGAQDGERHSFGEFLFFARINYEYYRLFSLSQYF